MSLTTKRCSDKLACEFLILELSEVGQVNSTSHDL